MYGGSKIETETTATADRSGLGLVGIWKYISLPHRQTSSCIQALVQSSTQRHNIKASRFYGYDLDLTSPRTQYIPDLTRQPTTIAYLKQYDRSDLTLFYTHNHLLHKPSPFLLDPCRDVFAPNIVHATVDVMKLLSKGPWKPSSLRKRADDREDWRIIAEGILSVNTMGIATDVKSFQSGRPGTKRRFPCLI